MTQNSELKHKTVKGLAWGGFNTVSRQSIGILLGLILLNHLTPGDYGLVGMLTIFITIASTLQESGFTAALINKKEVDSRDYNSVFWFCLSVSAIIYLTLFFCAPLIADFYHKSGDDKRELVTLARVLFLCFFFSSAGIAQGAYYHKGMMQKQKAGIEVVSSLVAGTGATVAACSGYGYWALVTNVLLQNFLITLLRWIYCPWKPSLSFSLKPVKEMFSFSMMLMFSSIVSKIRVNIVSIVLGRRYSQVEVGYFSQGQKWTTLLSDTISGTSNQVAQPVIVQTVDDSSRERQVISRFLSLLSMVSFPSLMGLAIIAEEFISIINEQFLPSVPVLQTLSLGLMFFPIRTYLSQVVISHKKSLWDFYVSLFCAIFLISSVIAFSRSGICFLASICSLMEIISIIPLFFFVKKLTGYNLTRLVKDIVPYLMISCAVMLLTYWAAGHISTVYLRLLVKILMAAALYVVALYLLGSSTLKELLNFIKSYRVS